MAECENCGALQAENTRLREDYNAQITMTEDARHEVKRLASQVTDLAYWAKELRDARRRTVGDKSDEALDRAVHADTELTVLLQRLTPTEESPS